MVGKKQNPKKKIEVLYTPLEVSDMNINPQDPKLIIQLTYLLLMVKIC